MPDQSRRRPMPTWAVPVAVIAVAAALIALALGLGRDEDAPALDSGSADRDAPGAGQEPGGPDLSRAERRDETDLLAAGPVDAPVTLVVFSDYQCPFCGRWSRETLPKMMEHVEDGDLRVEWRDVNIFGPASERAARASYAAAAQGSFWEYHDALFPGGEPRSKGDLDDEALIALADELGLDAERFADDLESEETAEQIDVNARLGLDLGVSSTPAFVLGGRPIVGAQPSEAFEDAFDAALAAAR